MHCDAILISITVQSLFVLDLRDIHSLEYCYIYIYLLMINWKKNTVNPWAPLPGFREMPFEAQQRRFFSTKLHVSWWFMYQFNNKWIQMGHGKSYLQDQVMLETLKKVEIIEWLSYQISKYSSCRCCTSSPKSWSTVFKVEFFLPLGFKIEAFH